MINGNKVILRPFIESDKKHTYKFRTNIEIINSLLSYPLPVSDIVEGEWMKGILENKTPEHAYFAITTQNANEFIGYCSLKNIDYLNGNAEVGIVILPEHQKKGYASEAIELVSLFSLNNLRLHKIYCHIRVDNESSISMFKKVGYIFEGLLKEHVYRDKKYFDIAIFAFFKDKV